MVRKVALVVAVVAGLTFVVPGTARADVTVSWSGKGLPSVWLCDYDVDRPNLHWVLRGADPAPGTIVNLFLNGHNAGTMTADAPHGSLQLTMGVPPWFTHEMLEVATVAAAVMSGSVADGAVLTVSGGCVCRYD
jgi:hypothetical protein